MSHRPWPILFIALSLFLFACSGGSSTSQGENPFNDAKANLKSSDFKAALRNLDKAIKFAPDDATKQQAIVLRTALVTALADANKQMAEAYYVGAKEPIAVSHTAPFHKMKSDYYSTANSFLMDAMQSTMDQRSKLPTASATPIEITFPGFTGTNAGLTKIKTGQLVSDSEVLTAEAQADRNCLAMVLAGFAGASQNPNKAEELFNAGKVTVDPRVYIIVLSEDFLQTGEMFESRGGLNQPDKMRTVNDVVRGNLEVAQKLLDAKPDKDLQARLKKIQSDMDKSTKKSKV